MLHNPCRTRKHQPAFIWQFSHVKPGLILRRRQSYTGLLTPCPNRTRQPLRQAKVWWCLTTKHDPSGWHRSLRTSVVWCTTSCQVKTIRCFPFQGDRQPVAAGCSQCHDGQRQRPTTFANKIPENIIPTNMLDKWERQHDGTVKAKSR